MLQKRFTPHEQMATVLEYECAFDNEKGEWLSIRDTILCLNTLYDETIALKSSNMEYEDMLGRLEETLDYYKSKCASLETGLINEQRRSFEAKQV